MPALLGNYSEDTRKILGRYSEMPDARTQLQQTIDARLADIDARKQAKIEAANKEADDEIGAIIARLSDVSLLPLIHTQTGSDPSATLSEVPAVPPMPAEEAGD